MAHSIFEYKFIDDTLESHASEIISKYISNGVQSNPWYKNFPLYVNSLEKTYIAHWKNLISKLQNNLISQEAIEQEMASNRGNPGLATVKKCPGISDLLVKSLVITSPCEMYFELRNKEIFSKHISSERLVKVDGHPTNQFNRSGDTTFDDIISIKFQFPIIFKSDSYIGLQPPTYHDPRNSLPLATGIISEKYTRLNDINLSFFIDVSEDKDIHIKEGQPLAYFWNHNSFRIKHNPSLVDLRLKTTFNKNFKSVI